MHYYVIMATCCFLLLSLVFPTPAPAQVNIEKFRTTAKETGFSGFFELDLASRSGNVDITELTLDSRGDYSWETMSTFLIVRGDYGWAKGGRFSDEALGHVLGYQDRKGKVEVECLEHPAQRGRASGGGPDGQQRVLVVRKRRRRPGRLDPARPGLDGLAAAGRGPDQPGQPLPGLALVAG